MQNITTLFDLLFIVVPLLLLVGVTSRQVMGYTKASHLVEDPHEKASLKARLMHRLVIQWIVVVVCSVVLYSVFSPAFRASDASNLRQVQQTQGEFRETERVERRSADELRSGAESLRERTQEASRERVEEIDQRRQEVIDEVHQGSIPQE